MRRAEEGRGREHLVDHADQRRNVVLDKVRHEVAADKANTTKDENARLRSGGRHGDVVKAYTRAHAHNRRRKRENGERERVYETAAATTWQERQQQQRNDARGADGTKGVG